LTFAKRGFETVISFHGEEASPRLDDETYVACVEACPVGAITLKETDALASDAKKKA
jgi:ferredoxin